jgi:ABC-type nickel/cobalt efflux system permease component RcnA
VSDVSTYMLLVTAGGMAVLHTLIPDHWLPFALIGRARGWTVRTTAMISGFSALIHVTLSILLGFLALGIGVAASEAIGETLERAGAVLLVLFGLAYAWWAWRKGGHFHPGGRWLHSGGDGADCACTGDDTNPEHLYYHADGEMIRARRGWTGISLALIVGANPCVLLLPIMLNTAPHGTTAIWLVSAAYAAPTVLLMIGLSALGVAGGRRIRLPAAARHMELASGLLIALLGLAFFWIEL